MADLSHPSYTLPTWAPPPATPGWRELVHGEKVRTHHQWYAFLPGQPAAWRITSYVNKQGLINDGRVHYREAASLKAWTIVLCQWVVKTYKRARGLPLIPPPQ